jgi:hypothetical protein
LEDRADKNLRFYQDGGSVTIKNCEAERDLTFYAATSECSELTRLTAGRDLSITASTAQELCGLFAFVGVVGGWGFGGLGCVVRGVALGRG